MNKERMQQVIDALKSVKDGDRLGFNMGTWIGDSGEWEDKTQHNCGTVACIAGWAHSLSQPKVNALSELKGDTETEAQKWLELNYEDARRLFLGGLGDYVDLDEVTVEQAIKVMEHAIKTGEINWEII